VGSGALGDMVARGLQRNEFGEGVVASLAILALGIALDRVTQGHRATRTERSGGGPLFGFGKKRRQVQPGGGAV
jgi:ABC-type proline/glycine betaine transport system permease subunit